MHNHWADHVIHCVNAVLAFSVNGLLLYILQDDKKLKLGHYRYLIMLFAFFNLVNSCGDTLIPVRVHDHRYAFSVFIVDGLLEKRSVFGTIMLSFRCSLIAATYGILHSHFVYRYLALFRNKILTIYFVPYGILLTIANCLLPMAIWTFACYSFLGADDERRLYMKDEIAKNYHGNVFEINILVAQYSEASDENILKSWIGIGTKTTASVASFTTDIVLGVLIVQKLKNAGMIMSERTLHVQKQLMKALTVQVTVPLMASLTPCLYAWYKPMFNISAGQWIDAIDVIAISFFPVLDPLALFYFVPVFNSRIRQMFRVRKTENESSVARSTIRTVESTV